MDPNERPASALPAFYRYLTRPGWKLVIVFWVIVLMGLYITRHVFQGS